MFRKVAQGFTNAATKPGCLGPFQRSLPQQESALSNAYESNDRNVTGLSYKKNTTKVQQLEIFPTQYIGVSKFLLGRIPASGSGKPSLEGDVQFKKLRDIARLNPALCHSESQPVGFGANQQAVKNILAEREKSDILSGTWGLMQNPISHSFREGEMYTNKQHVENSQEEQLQDKKKLKSQIKEPNDQATKPTEEKNQLDKDLNITKQSLNEKDGKLESKDEELKNETQQLKALKSENKELKTKLQKSEKKNKELNEELDRRISKVNTLTEGKEQLEKNLNSTKQSLNEKDKELTSENEKLKGQNQRLEELKSTNEGKIQQLESRIKELEALKSENESQIKGLQKELEDNKDSKPSAVNAQEVKSKANYTAASFMLSWVCAVGASLATPYLAICATLAVAASVFLALGCYYSYKTNTALSNVEVVDRLGKQPLLVE